MYRDSFNGTAEQLKTHVNNLKLPTELPSHEAIRAFILAHIPTYGVMRWTLMLSCESAANQGGNRMAGFISVAVMEL
jgi:hypothetical protein